ncbi:hypothetical protein CXG81DRAFT_26532 [Caulochytrium protostelioides]|uniref:Swiss Army Knife RNA repair protein HAD domain-containing protein n=1 Tax=Caulochytrium protostelioides TaxID=1555241 RepID=A0A4P9X6J0_9FUNG|nr:hypothetical protein CXG81DRAFT_26532 [Caulochytrium protostelioides]|eukprot:RKP00788.1 hypothetical protein CXG81DRAFT_26532 [Caulochytrium protostelioides]
MGPPRTRRQREGPARSPAHVYDYEHELNAWVQERQAAEGARLPTELIVFDFDSTLFRSPQPNPAVWTADAARDLIHFGGWFATPWTLGPPGIAPAVDASWWIDHVADAARAALAQPAATRPLVVMMTGRRRDRFADRIRTLCEQAGLAFDLYIFREGQDAQRPGYIANTLLFKCAVLTRILAALPSLRHITMWDDRLFHVNEFTAFLGQLQAQGRLDGYEVCFVDDEPLKAKFIERHVESREGERLLVSYPTHVMRHTASSGKPPASARNYRPPRVVDIPMVKLALDEESGMLLQSTLPDPWPTALWDATTLELHGDLPTMAAVATQLCSMGASGTTPAASETLLTTTTTTTTATTAGAATAATDPETQVSTDTVTETATATSMTARRVSFAVYQVGFWPRRLQCIRVLPLPPNQRPPSSPPDADALFDLVVYRDVRAKRVQSDKVWSWEALASPLVIEADVTVTWLRGVDPSAARSTAQAQRGARRPPRGAIAVGDLVRQYHPQLTGPQIGKMCRAIEQHMTAAALSNTPDHVPQIEQLARQMAWPPVLPTPRPPAAAATETTEPASPPSPATPRDE